MPNQTNIPAPRVPLTDERTGFISREWYRFFNNIFLRAGGGNSTASITDVLVETGSATAGASLDQLAAVLSDIQAAQVDPVAPVMPNPAYALFSSSINQVGGVITNAYAVTYDTTVYARGIRLVTNSRLTATQAGLYHIHARLSGANSTGASALLDVWLAKNGTNIANAGARVSVPATGSAAGVLSYQVALADGDYVEVYWRQADIGVTLEAVAAAATPTRPTYPSAIVSMALISTTLY